MNLSIRPATRADRQRIAEMMCALWPDGSITDSIKDVDDILTNAASALPLTIYLVENDRYEIIGFIEVGLRSHADV